MSAVDNDADEPTPEDNVRAIPFLAVMAWFGSALALLTFGLKADHAGRAWGRYGVFAGLLGIGSLPLLVLLGRGVLRAWKAGIL